MINVIIGRRSNLTQKLLSVLNNSLAISSSSIMKEMDNIDWKSHSVNLIFNQFQPATKLNDLTLPTDYIDNAIGSTAKVLEFIKSRSIDINKIIYTSSSSVYGNNKSCHENDVSAPVSLHAVLKIANEKLVSNFCQDIGIDYTIARLFNMYGGDDNFSIVSKIINCFKHDQTLTLVNDGQAIRDFIHIDDVVNIYCRILATQNLPIVNIASGKEESVMSILNHLKNNQIILKTNNIVLDEISISIANNSKLLSTIGEYHFLNVKEYIANHIKQ